MVKYWALGNNIQPRWRYLLVCDSGIDYASDISRGICLTGSTLASSGCYTGVTIQLEKYIASCDCWVNVPTYCWDVYDEDNYAEIFVDNIGLSAGTYRCSLVYTAYDTYGLELESFTANSNEITVR